MAFYRINPDGSRTKVEGNPFEQPGTPAQPPELGASEDRPSLGYDLMRSAGTGLRQGAEGLVGLPGTIETLGRWGLNKTGAANVDPEPVLPDIGDIGEATSSVIGEHYKPQTTAGKYARTVGEFVPGALTGGIGAASRGLPFLGRLIGGGAVAPGIASEAAGQATEGTALEPWARAGAGLLTGIGASMALAPREALTRAQVAREGVHANARRHGVDLPEYMMPDAPAQAIAARRAADLPFLGSPVRRAAENAATQMGQRVDDIAGQIGNTDLGTVSANTKNALEDFVTDAAPAAQAREYRALEASLARPDLETPLRDTRILVRDFLNEMAEDTTRSAEPVIRQLREAIMRPNGLTVDGVKRLRTSIREQMDDNMMPAASRSVMRRVHAALTKDYERAVQRAGGPSAVQALDRANATTRVSKEVSREVQTVVGKTGNVPADQVMGRIRKLMEAHDSTTDNRLMQMRVAIEEADNHFNAGRQGMAQRDSWADLAAATLADMGRDPKNPGRFSPKHYLDSWSKMSDTGKDIMFSNTGHRRALDELADIARNYRDYRNPSAFGFGMTAAAGGLLGAGAITSWPATLGAVIGGRAIATMMSRPASTQKLLSFARALRGGRDVSLATVATAARGVAEDAAEIEGRDPNELFRELMGAAGGREQQSD